MQEVICISKIILDTINMHFTYEILISIHTKLSFVVFVELFKFDL